MIPRSRAANIALAVLGFCVFGLEAQAPKPTEYEVQAAYLSNFGRFVVWPPKAGEKGPFYICVLGQDPFGPALDAAVKGETIGGQPMIARRIASAGEAAGCRIVYINPAKDTQLKGLFEAVKKYDALTVGDSPDFTKQGGMIQFVLEGNRVRFEINVAAAKQARLTLSSELLRVASAVSGEPQGR